MGQLEFNLQKAEEQKEIGQQLAASAKKTVLAEARMKAIELATKLGKVTIDDVQKCFEEPLGNIAGSVFKGDMWEFTGEWQKSERVSNHARVVRVWRLK